MPVPVTREITSYDVTIRLRPEADDMVVSLPPAATRQGRTLTLKREVGGTKTCTVAAAAGETIDGLATITLPNLADSIVIVADAAIPGYIKATTGAASSIGELPGDTPPGDPALGTPVVTFAGLKARVAIPLTPPSPIGEYTGAWIYIDAPDRSASSPANWTAELVGWAATGDDVYFERDWPEVNQFWRVYAVGGSDQIERKPVMWGRPGASPSAQFLVTPAPAAGSGVEFVPLVTGFAADATEYSTTEGGQQVWRKRLTWSWPTAGANAELLRGVRIIREDGAQKIEQGRVTREDGAASAEWTSEWEPVPSSPTSYRFSAVSYDLDERTNDLVTGVTPSTTFSVQRQNGGSGQEYAPLLSGFSLSVTNAAAQDGTAFLRHVASWSVPADSRYGGAVLVVVKPAGTREIGGAALPSFEHHEPGPASVESWTYYLVTVDTNGRRNSVIPGTTPSITLNVGSSFGMLNSAKLASIGAEFDATFGLRIRSGGLQNTHYAAGSIDTLKLTTGQLYVGGGGNKPIEFVVYDNFGSPIGFVGQSLAYGISGGWFKTLYQGGSSPFNANVKSDSSGNTTIENATYSLFRNGNYTKINNDAATGYFASFLTHDSGNNNPVVITPGVIQMWSSLSGGQRVVLTGNNFTNGTLRLYDTGGVESASLGAGFGCILRNNPLIIRDAFSTTRFSVDANGNISYSGPTTFSASSGFVSVPAFCKGFIQATVNGGVGLIPYF